MSRIELTELERLALAKAGAQSIPCNNGWQPIETAPKNVWILVTEQTGSRIDQVRWVPEPKVEGYNWTTMDGALQPNDALKYWMPLPQPPTTKDDE